MLNKKEKKALILKEKEVVNKFISNHEAEIKSKISELLSTHPLEKGRGEIMIGFEMGKTHERIDIIAQLYSDISKDLKAHEKASKETSSSKEKPVLTSIDYSKILNSFLKGPYPTDRSKKNCNYKEITTDDPVEQHKTLKFKAEVIYSLIPVEELKAIEEAEQEDEQKSTTKKPFAMY